MNNNIECKWSKLCNQDIEQPNENKQTNKKKKTQPGTVAHVCNPSTLGS